MAGKLPVPVPAFRFYGSPPSYRCRKVKRLVFPWLQGIRSRSF
ncbi:hypothetical protein LINGRAHAP2_LOCUS22727 [Linum grandiflorum]